jgi:hypothetical protein
MASWHATLYAGILPRLTVIIWKLDCLPYGQKRPFVFRQKQLRGWPTTPHFQGFCVLSRQLDAPPIFGKPNCRAVDGAASWDCNQKTLRVERLASFDLLMRPAESWHNVLPRDLDHGEERGTCRRCC